MDKVSSRIDVHWAQKKTDNYVFDGSQEHYVYRKAFGHDG